MFKATRTLSRKKIVRKRPHSSAGCIVGPYNASRQPIHQFWSKWVMVVTLMCARGSAPHVARGRKTLKRHGFLYKHGKTSKGHNFNCKVWIKNLSGQISSLTHSACSCKIIPPSAPNPPWIRLFNYLNLLFFLLSVIIFFQGDHTLSRKKWSENHLTVELDA